MSLDNRADEQSRTVSGTYGRILHPVRPSVFVTVQRCRSLLGIAVRGADQLANTQRFGDVSTSCPAASRISAAVQQPVLVISELKALINA